MKAMILAAGKGERMRPLTNECPKPMLKVKGKPLLEHRIDNLKRAGITEFVINLAWFGEKIEQYFGDGSRWQVTIQYSYESVGELETAGGIIKALPLLGDAPFLLVNGDVFCAPDYQQLMLKHSGDLATLFLVENPTHNPKGDFSLSADRVILPDGKSASYTYSGIALLSPALFSAYKSHQGPLPLGPLLKNGCENKSISGIVLDTPWTDVGTPERLALLNQQTSNHSNEKEQ